MRVFLISLFILFSFIFIFAQDISELLKKSNDKFKRGDYLVAIKDMDKIIEENKTNAEAYQKRGRSKRYLNNLQGALADYNTALRINPNNGNTYIGRAQTNLRLQQYEVAIQDYNAALKIQPNTKFLKEILYNRALAYHQLNKIKEALEDYNKVLEMSPDDVKSLVNRGMIRYVNGEIRTACTDWIKAKDLGNEKANNNALKACKCCM